MHVALLGDSTLDNGAYTGDGPSVSEQLGAELGAGHTVTLLAVDGDTTRQIPDQVSGVPRTASHLVLSVGGNDALGYANLLQHPVETISEAVSRLSEAVAHFEELYRRCLGQVLDLELPTIVCTVYNGAFPDPDLQRVITTTVRLFDDVIVQAASDAGCATLDLRRTCDSPDDYWNPIEPNARGGAKIARALGRLLVDGSRPGVYPVRRPAR